MVTGIPPFSTATKQDKFFNNLSEDKPELFWENIGKLIGVEIKLDDDLKSFLLTMLNGDPEKRLTIEQIKENAWYAKDDVPTKEEIKEEFTRRTALVN
jgi:serine/threonine protein kinase